MSCYELGHQPFNLASPAAHLTAAGFHVDCQDLAIEPLNDDLVKEADLVAFSTPMHTALRLARLAARRVRAINPTCHISFYGLYAGMHADMLVNKENGFAYADSVLGGEFETPLVDLAQTLSNRNGHARSRILRVDNSFERQQFLLPKRDRLPPIEKYSRLLVGDRTFLTGYVEASRGCAHHCLHCPITPVYAGRVRIVQEEVVLADIEQLLNLGAQHITFGDPDFLNAIKHSLRIVREMHQRFPGLTFDFTAKVEHLLQHRELLPEFQELGCVFVVSAVELLNDVILGYLQKGHTGRDIEETLQIVQDAGIALRPSLMPFTPWTTIQDLVDILSLVERHQLYDQIDPVQYGIRLLIPPNSSLLTLPELQPSLVGFDSEKWIYQWRSEDEKVDVLHSQISRVVEKGARDQEDRFSTYLKIRELVLECAGSHTLGRLPEYRRKQYVPRLTEDWFC